MPLPLTPAPPPEKETRIGDNVVEAIDRLILTIEKLIEALHTNIKSGS